MCRMKPRYQFLVNNLVKGLMWFAILILVFIAAREYLNLNPAWIEALYDRLVLIYSIFIFSEVIFGIIPPELFMLWSLKGGLTDYYVVNVLFLSVLSYAAGVFGYFIGSSCRVLPLFQSFEVKYLHQYKSSLRRYGGYLVIAATLTPLPFSAVAMAVGVFKYSFKYYLLYSLTRFLRFGVYGYILWLSNG